MDGPLHVALSFDTGARETGAVHAHTTRAPIASPGGTLFPSDHLCWDRDGGPRPRPVCHLYVPPDEQVTEAFGLVKTCEVDLECFISYLRLLESWPWVHVLAVGRSTNRTAALDPTNRTQAPSPVDSAPISRKDHKPEKGVHQCRPSRTHQSFKVFPHLSTLWPSSPFASKSHLWQWSKQKKWKKLKQVLYLLFDLCQLLGSRSSPKSHCYEACLPTKRTKLLKL